MGDSAVQHRTVVLKSGVPSGDFVLYWMQASVRVRGNLALAAAAQAAQDRGLPLAVLFCLDATYPEANARSFAFLLDGLEDLSHSLEERGLRLTVALGSAASVIPVAARDAALVVFDKGYLPFQRTLRQRLASGLENVIEVEDNVSVPVATVSDHEEWSAATLRPKLMRLAGLEPAPQPGEPRWGGARTSPHVEARWLERGLPILAGRPGRQLIASLGVDPSVPPTSLRGGESAALTRWEEFLNEKLENYDTRRNDPNLDGPSGLAPYLHFGHLSPLTIMGDLRAQGRWVEALSYRRAGEDPVSKFLDEVLVRRELSVNLVYFNPLFDRFEGLPEWSKRTLASHTPDRRDYLYSDDQWENSMTHDAAWNASQNQLKRTGVLHGYMRMYWGKKLLEWSADPARALALALRLNNKYALDGRDPNSYAGVAWCFGKHDRPWGERDVYGMVRCMTSGGLARKFDLAAYVQSQSSAPADSLQPDLWSAKDPEVFRNH